MLPSPILLLILFAMEIESGATDLALTLFEKNLTLNSKRHWAIIFRLDLHKHRLLCLQDAVPFACFRMGALQPPIRWLLTSFAQMGHPRIA